MRSLPTFAFIPSPPSNGVQLGPLFIHAYGMAYLVAVLVAIAIVRRRWAARGGDPALVQDVAIVAFPAGIVGGRLYFLATSCAALIGTGSAGGLAGRRGCRRRDHGRSPPRGRGAGRLGSRRRPVGRCR